MRERPNAASLLRHALPVLAVLIGAAVIYDGFVFYSLSEDAKRVQREREKAEADRARRTIQILGGDNLKILAFYASPSLIHPGDHSLLCFGVTGATKVRIDPPIVEDLHPSLSRCFQVAPQKDTEYKLTAEDATGHTATQSMAIRIAR